MDCTAIISCSCRVSCRAASGSLKQLNHGSAAACVRARVSVEPEWTEVLHGWLHVKCVPDVTAPTPEHVLTAGQHVRNPGGGGPRPVQRGPNPEHLSCCLQLSLQPRLQRIIVLVQGSTFGIPGVEEHAHFLRDVKDAERIRNHLLTNWTLANIPGAQL